MFGRDAARKTNVLAVRAASLTTGGTCTVRERAVELSHRKPIDDRLPRYTSGYPERV